MRATRGYGRRLAPLVDCNLHLWDQSANPVFWLTDRTLVRDMIGNYDSLPDTYTLADYRRDVAGHDVRGIVWSDAGADDPIAAAAWVQRQCIEMELPAALVTLGDPADDGFPELVARFRELPLARSVRVRLGAALAPGAADRALLDDARAMANLELPAEHELVATLEATGEQLDVVARLARAVPTLPERCMLGSDMPIERLRSGFDQLYDAYEEIFSDLDERARSALFGVTAQRWYGIDA